MKPQDIIKFSYNALRNRKLRAALTIIGIAIGPATIVALIAATGGFANQATAQFQKLGAETILVSPVGRIAVAGAGQSPFGGNNGGGASLDVDNQKALAGLDGVKTVLPYYRVSATMRTGTQNSQVSIIALDTVQLRSLFPGIQISEGSEPGSSEFTSALVGYNVAHPGGASSDLTLNQVVSVSYSVRNQRQSTTESRSFVVKGVLNQFGQGLFLNPDDTIFVNMGTGRLLTKSNTYSGFYVVAKSADDVTDIVGQINDRYSSEMRATTVSSILSTVQTITSNISNLLGSIAAVSVVVAFTGIMTTMLTSVNERVREIGMLKALGTTRRGITLIFLSEAVLAGFIGGLIGAAMGSSLSFWVASSLFSGGLGIGGPVRLGARPPGQGGGAAAPAVAITPAITPELFAGAVVLAVVVAILAGMIPAWKASKLTPVQALSRE
ncbi:MAG TPA: ABC transporter permease [Nitrososphaerales archaeon]